MPEDQFSSTCTYRPVPRSASTAFLLNGKPLPYSLGAFWQWAASDLLSNTLRGVLAEFIVAQALNCDEGCRQSWRPFDLQTTEGLRIEVKSAAYRQAWHQLRPSPIRFSIGETKAWDAATGTFASQKKRQADVYVFCVFNNEDAPEADPLELSRWKFYILRSTVLNRECSNQKSISLSRISGLKARMSDFTGLKHALKTAVSL